MLEFISAVMALYRSLNPINNDKDNDMFCASCSTNISDKDSR
ncbi:hypothetical protein CZ794_12105 [Psychrobacter sp. JB385]|nr:hypothetical protein CZ794_12105 [Psychrobacter sp. JB385]